MNLWQLFRNREHIRKLIEYAKLSHNTRIWDGDKITHYSGERGNSFKGNWVAIPEVDFDKVRDTVSRIHGWRG